MTNPKYSNEAVNSEATALAALYNNGYKRMYTGAQPATADTALSGQTLCAELRFGATAFGAPANGVLTANAITKDSSADNTGKARFFRDLKSDGSSPLGDGSIGMAITRSDISFISGTKKINRAAGDWTADTTFLAGDTIVISGSASNNGTYTIASINATDITVNETLVTEGAGAAITVTMNGDINLTTACIQQGAEVSLTSFTITVSKG